MPTREELLKVCGLDAPEESEPDPQPDMCGEISIDGYRICVLDVGHSGPHAYEFPSQKPQPAPPKKYVSTIDTTGMVLHCAECNSELTYKCSSTHTGYWCDKCCYPPSIQDTYLARPKPKFR